MTPLAAHYAPYRISALPTRVILGETSVASTFSLEFVEAEAGEVACGGLPLFLLKSLVAQVFMRSPGCG